MTKYRVRQVNPKEYVVEGFMYSHTDDGVDFYDWFLIDRWGYISERVTETCVFNKVDEAKKLAAFLMVDGEDKVVYETTEPKKVNRKKK